MSLLDTLKVNKNFKFPETKFDLQSHTLFSDGRKTPKALLDSASHNGLEVVSITDHNTLKAYDQKLFDFAKSKKIKLIPGIELECFGELDVLVYENSENSITQSFVESLNRVASLINKKRNKYVNSGLENIKKFLQSSTELSWMNWKFIDNEAKDHILKSITFENASNVNLDTGIIENFGRDYISKPHLAVILSQFNLVNIQEFASTHGLSIDKASKSVLKILFDKYIDWPIDHLEPDSHIIKEIAKLPYIKIIAHPGKSFEVWEKIYPGTRFGEYLTGLLNFGLDGAEIDYRNYKSQLVNYNDLTQKTLIGYHKPMYGTGGSDTHSLFGD